MVSLPRPLESEQGLVRGERGLKSDTHESNRQLKTGPEARAARVLRSQLGAFWGLFHSFCWPGQR